MNRRLGSMTQRDFECCERAHEDAQLQRHLDRYDDGPPPPTPAEAAADAYLDERWAGDHGVMTGLWGWISVPPPAPPREDDQA